MHSLNKKGLSEIIVNVFLIIIVLSSVSLIALSITKMVNNPALSPETSCPILLSKKPVTIERACYTKEAGEIQITLQRRNEMNIHSLDFVLDNEKYSCGNSCGTCNMPSKTNQNTQTYYFTTTQKNKTAIIINGCLLEEAKVIEC